MRRTSRRRTSYTPNGKRRTSKDTDTRSLIDAALAAGWRIEYASQGSHFKLFPADPKMPIVVGTLGSVGPRGWRNFRSQLRRSGLAVNRAQSDDALAREFNRTINMSSAEILDWYHDPRSKLASFPHIRKELPLLAEMKRTSPSRWTPRMWDKAMRAVNFVKRHEAQMKVQGRQFGTGRLHVTKKRVIALLNWGRKTPGISVEKAIS